MKSELTSTHNILVIDKDMYLFPELFFCDTFIDLHAPIERDPTTTIFSITQTSYFGQKWGVVKLVSVGRAKKTPKIENFGLLVCSLEPRGDLHMRPRGNPRGPQGRLQ